MRSLWLLLLMLNASLNAWAEISVLQVDGEYRATGYSSLEKPSDAEREACNDAKRDLITYIFGAAYQVNQNVIRTLGVVDYAQDVQMNSNEVVLRGVLLDRIADRPYKCVIHYPVEEARLEQERLKARASLSQPAHFTEVGVGGSRGGILEVVTVPEDVHVYVDNEHWGTTPLRLNQKLTVGPHLIRLEHPDYQVIEETVEIGTLQTTRIERLLKRATGTLQVETDPEGAQIQVNGQDVGVSPVRALPVLAGQKIVVTARHTEAEDSSQTLMLARNEQRTLKLSLPKKPAYVSFDVEPKDGTRVTLDSALVESKERWLPVEPGNHTMKFEREGYESASIDFEVRGGDRKALQKAMLTIAKATPTPEPSPAVVSSRETASETSVDSGIRVIHQPGHFEGPLLREWQPEITANQIHFGFGYSNEAFKLPEQRRSYVCCGTFDMGYKRALFSWFVLGAAYHLAAGETMADLPDNGDEGPPGTSFDRVRSYTQHEGELNAQLYWCGGWFVGGSMGWSVTNVHFERMRYDSSGHGTIRSERWTTVKQKYQGASFGYHTRPDAFPQTKLGGYAFLNWKRYNDTTEVVGENVYSFNFGLTIGF